MPHETITHNGRPRLRWYPAGAVKLTDKNKLATVYTYTTGKGSTAVLAYAGNATRAAFHESYRKPEAAAKRVSEYFAALAQHEERKRQERERASSGHTLKVGDIITNSWGYDQTNVDWYRIVQTSKCFVWLQPISGATTPEESCGPMSGYSTPHVDTSSPDPTQWKFADKAGKVTKHKAVGASVSMKYGSGSLWDGQAKYESWYA